MLFTNQTNLVNLVEVHKRTADMKSRLEEMSGSEMGGTGYGHELQMAPLPLHNFNYTNIQY
jgi:hypothetical protein